jgi:DNA-binding XRE family transcriptional regulator
MAAAARRVPMERPIAQTKIERAQKRLQETVAKNLLRLRTEASLSQRQMSERTGISATYISQAEQGKRNLSLDLVATLALALDKTPADLIRE